MNLGLAALRFFSGVPDAVRDALLSGGHEKRYAKGDLLFMQDTPADKLFIVIDGWVKIYRTTPQGEEAVLALLKTGDAFGEASIFGHSLYPVSATAAEDAAVFEIPGHLLRAQAKASHEVMARVMDSMSRDLRNLQMENEHLALMSAPQRVGCLLLQFSSGTAGAGGSFTLPYDKSLAAARLGMKPETFSRALQALKPVGVSVDGPRVTVASFGALVDYCCTHCSALPGECPGAREGCDRAATCPGKKFIKISDK